MRWLALRVVVGTACGGWHWVRWLALGVVVGTACGGWHCVRWLALRVVVGTACGGLKTVSAAWCDDAPCCPLCPTPSQLSWSPDSRQVLTASGDKSCKIFDVETSQVVTYVQWI